MTVCYSHLFPVPVNYIYDVCIGRTTIFSPEGMRLFLFHSIATLPLFCISRASISKYVHPSISFTGGNLTANDPLSVEYAMEAISHAGTVLGVLAKDGVVLAAEKKVTGKLLDLSGASTGGYGGSGEKIFLLNT